MEKTTIDWLVNGSLGRHEKALAARNLDRAFRNHAAAFDEEMAAGTSLARAVRRLIDGIEGFVTRNATNRHRYRDKALTQISDEIERHVVERHGAMPHEEEVWPDRALAFWQPHEREIARPH